MYRRGRSRRHARDELMATSRRDYSIEVSRRADGEPWRLNFVELSGGNAYIIDQDRGVSLMPIYWYR